MHAQNPVQGHFRGVYLVLLRDPHADCHCQHCSELAAATHGPDCASHGLAQGYQPTSLSPVGIMSRQLPLHQAPAMLNNKC